MDDRGQYSTLELANPQPHNGHNGPNGHADGLEIVPQNNYPQVVDNNNLPEVKSDPPYNNYPEAVPQYDGAVQRRICGLTKKMFIIVAALVALLVVGAVVGGAVGGTVGKSKSTTKASSMRGSPTTSAPPAASTTASSTSPILSNSSLSSSNWTDSKGYSHYAVFYQRQSNSLMLSLWDSQNTTWVVKNVSATLSSTFAALPGTPLSTAVTSYPWPFQLNLYYLSPSNKILELFTLDDQGGGWTIGSLVTYNIVVGANSKLASYWQRCLYECSQEILLLYEDTSQNLNIANGSDWSKPYTIDENLCIGSGLALVPLAPPTDPNTQPYQLRAYFDVSEASQEFLWDGFTGYWYGGGLPNLPLTNSPPQFAAASFGTPSQGFYEIMLVFLFSNGSISANWFDNTNWHTYITPSPTMPKSNFSAIALNMDLRFYGISGGSIYEYSIDGSNPFDWSYVNPINTTFTS